MENLKRIYINTKNIIKKNKTKSVLIVNIIIVIIMLAIGLVQFETIDDYMIYELLSGKWGQPTAYVVYVNILLSNILLGLFNMLPSINWYVLTLIATHILSFTVLWSVINKKFNAGLKMYIILIIIVFIPFLIFLQYTSQAALLILTGFLYAWSIMNNNEKKTKLILPLFMIVMGSLIRFGALLYVIPYALVIFIVELLKKKCAKTEIITKIVFCIIALSVCVLLKGIHTNIYNNNPIYKEYLEYNGPRAIIHDYLGNNYTKNIDVYKSAGWSVNDYITMKLFNNADNVVFSKENMNYIVKNVKIAFPSVRYIFSELLHAFFLPYLIILVSMAIVSIKQKKSANLLIAILAICIEFAFIIMGKVNIRTCVLNYIIAIVFMIINLERIDNKITINITTFFILILLVILISTNVIIGIDRKNMHFSERYNKFLEYTNNNKQNAYVYSSHTLNDRYIKANILSTDEQKASNVCPIASWLIYSENYLNFKEKYNIDEMYKAILYNSNVYLVTSEKKFGSGYTELEIICNYLKEHHLVDNINIEEITNFDNLIYVFKLSI